jgi:hypothetical protein
MISTLLGMLAVYVVGAGILALLGMAFQFDKDERKKHGRL